MSTLRALPLTAERFAPFGDVIEASAGRERPMNSARFERYTDLSRIDAGDDGKATISIARCRAATRLPYQIDMLERHPFGSQAFIPLSGFVFVVAVAPAAQQADAEAIQAFVSNGRQGVNYHPGVWHMPMIALEAGQEFLIVDRAGGNNCDEQYLDEALLLEL